MSKRPDIDTYFMEMAKLVASRSTCRHRQVGCVLVDKNNHILSTGYNGAPRGVEHCSDLSDEVRCQSDLFGREYCVATHAEQNALLQCKDVNEIETCYTTVSPCMQCLKLLLNTSCKRIVFIEQYGSQDFNIIRKVWSMSDRKWEKYSGRVLPA